MLNPATYMLLVLWLGIYQDSQDISVLFECTLSGFELSFFFCIRNAPGLQLGSLIILLPVNRKLGSHISKFYFFHFVLSVSVFVWLTVILPVEIT
jgi:hypothetical protein